VGDLTFVKPIAFGSVYWVNFSHGDPPDKVEETRILDWHPAVIISSTPFCLHSPALNVLALTSYRGKRIRIYHHFLSREKYPQLDGDSLVKAELAYPVLRQTLADQHYICTLDEADLRAILEKVSAVLGVTAFYELVSF
jgi:hypothetical protein